MRRKYLAFDIETAKDVPEDFSLWRNHRPLGICCAATLASDETIPRRWHSLPTSNLTRDHAGALLEYLLALTVAGYTIVTWNGAGFDFDVLGEETGRPGECRELALNHVDMMFHIVCLRGRGVALDKAARGLGLPGKLDGMTGAEVPARWRDGEHERVFAYAEQDVRLTLQIAEECTRRGEFAWISSEEERKSLPLANGWIAVREALTLPLPDVSGIEDPRARADYVGWLCQTQG